MKRGLTVVLTALVLLTGCDGGYGDGGYGDGGYGDGEDRFVYNLVSMEIADAQSLYLGLPEEKDGVTARGMDGYVLFKITKDGIIAKVKFHYEKEAVGDSENGNTENGNTENGNTENGNTENGNTENEDIDILQPQTVWNVNEEYFIVTFRNRDTYTDIPYLVSKKTGAVYSLENVGVPYDSPSMYANSSPVLSDGKNNIYFKIGKYNPDNPDKYAELYRIDVSNPEKVFAKALTAPKDNQIDAFAVDAAGNVVYNYYDINSNNGVRLGFAGGGYKNLNIDSCWTAPDGKLYYMGREWVSDEEAGEYGYPIYRLDIEGQKVTETEYGNGDFYISTYDSYYLTSGDRAYILNRDGRLAEVYNPDGKPNVTTLDYKLTGNTVDVSEDGGVVYITGQQEVVCIDLNTKTCEYLYQSDEYEIYEATYSGQGVTVNALRFRDGRIIMGEIDKTGKMEVLDEKSNSKVLYLTRIK